MGKKCEINQTRANFKELPRERWLFFVQNIDKREGLLYICDVLMYQHKGESPEPFEQQPIKFGMFHGYGK